MGAVVRLFSFRAVRPAFDGILRDELVPDIGALPGVLDCYSGRQGPEEVGPRIVVSVWETMAAMTDALGGEHGLGRFHPEYLDETTDRRLEVLPLRISQRFEDNEGARILRTLRGTIRPGEQDAYVQDVVDGLSIDVSRPNGPVALYLATIGDDGFITISAWRAWDDIEQATGGDVKRPRATRRPERLLDWEVEHFEIVGSG